MTYDADQMAALSGLLFAVKEASRVGLHPTDFGIQTEDDETVARVEMTDRHRSFRSYEINFFQEEE